MFLKSASMPESRVLYCVCVNKYETEGHSPIMPSLCETVCGSQRGGLCAVPGQDDHFDLYNTYVQIDTTRLLFRKGRIRTGLVADFLSDTYLGSGLDV